VQVRVLGAHGGSTPGHRQTSFLLDGRVALDAGALTETLTLEEQSQVLAILVTHSHMDHVASLPFLVENVFGRTSATIEVVAPPAVVASLRRHLFNNDLWPDFTRIPNHLLPTVAFREVEPRLPFQVHGITATAIPVDHLVPTCGYLVSGGGASVVFSGDTGPTEEIWSVARAAANLRGIFCECSFPDEMAEVARVSCHLTPALLAEEMRKFPPSVPVYLYHMKPPALPALRAQVAALGDPRVRILTDGETLDF
jgi:ribonuclease BN (tRNA processing enzyme)